MDSNNTSTTQHNHKFDDEFDDLRKKFHAGVLVTKLPWQAFTSAVSRGTETESLAVQNTVLDLTVRSAFRLKFPPPKSYERSFLKTFILKVEELCREVHEDALSLYSELVSTPSSDSYGFRTYLLTENRAIGIKENVNIISNGTTGLCTWQAALYLTEYCAHNKLLFKAKDVIELGSGQGLVGLNCITSCEPASYTFTDYHPDVLRNLVYNVEKNLETAQHPSEDIDVRYSGQWHQTEVKVRYCDWFEPDGLDSRTFEVILASDVVYDKDLIRPLVSTLKKLLHVDGSFALVASTVRNEETIQAFRTELGSQGLLYEELEEVPQLLCYERQQPVLLLRITQQCT